MDREWPIILNKDKFQLGFREEGHCLGGGCYEEYEPRDAGIHESFECTEIEDCIDCIINVDLTDISTGLDWLVSEGCITTAAALKFSLDYLSNKEE